MLKSAYCIFFHTSLTCYTLAPTNYCSTSLVLSLTFLLATGGGFSVICSIAFAWVFNNLIKSNSYFFMLFRSFLTPISSSYKISILSRNGSLSKLAALVLETLGVSAVFLFEGEGVKFACILVGVYS